MGDVKIKYINASKDNVKVVIFTKNFSPNGSPDFVAWNILETKDEEQEITYPEDITIEVSGANLEARKSGSFSAKSGSTWHVTQASLEAAPGLNRGIYMWYNLFIYCNHLDSDGPASNTIVVKNIKPGTWDGRKYNVAIHKSDRRLILQNGVNIGGQAEFVLESKVFFGVITGSVNLGEVFPESAITAKREFNLNDYAIGIKVTLSKDPVSTNYSFSAKRYDED